MLENLFSKKENNEGKQEISKIHFLVHPGYILESELVRNNYLGMESLLDDYIQKAKSLRQDELMIVFAPKIGKDFVHDFRRKIENGELPKKYVEAIREIADTLSDPEQKGVKGNRAIIFADTDVFKSKAARSFENRDKIWNKIIAIARKRGFVFKQGIEAEAYGEYQQRCVVEIARNMRFVTNSPITGPVQIKTRLTEQGHKYPDWILGKNKDN